MSKSFYILDPDGNRIELFAQMLTAADGKKAFREAGLGGMISSSRWTWKPPRWPADADVAVARPASGPPPRGLLCVWRQGTKPLSFSSLARAASPGAHIRPAVPPKRTRAC